MDLETVNYCARLRLAETKRRRERFFAQKTLLQDVQEAVNLEANEKFDDQLRVMARKSGAL